MLLIVTADVWAESVATVEAVAAEVNAVGIHPYWYITGQLHDVTAEYVNGDAPPEKQVDPDTTVVGEYPPEKKFMKDVCKLGNVVPLLTVNGVFTFVPVERPFEGPV